MATLIRIMCAGIVLAAIYGCEQLPGVDVINEGDESIEMYLDDRFVLSVQPGETKQLLTRKNLWPHVVRIVTSSGQTLLDEELTWKDLEDRDFEIVLGP